MTFSKNPGNPGNKGAVTFSYSKVLSLLSPLLEEPVTFSGEIGFCHFCHRQLEGDPQGSGRDD